jgi:hypothetical protein
MRNENFLMGNIIHISIYPFFNVYTYMLFELCLDSLKM